MSFRANRSLNRFIVNDPKNSVAVGDGCFCWYWMPKWTFTRDLLSLHYANGKTVEFYCMFLHLAWRYCMNWIRNALVSIWHQIGTTNIHNGDLNIPPFPVLYFEVISNSWCKLSCDISCKNKQFLLNSGNIYVSEAVNTKYVWS